MMMMMMMAMKSWSLNVGSSEYCGCAISVTFSFSQKFVSVTFLCFYRLSFGSLLNVKCLSWLAYNMSFSCSCSNHVILRTEHL